MTVPGSDSDFSSSPPAPEETAPEETASASASRSVATVEVIPGGPVHGTIRPPGSKSLTNRALICAAFASGESTLRGALLSEDTEVMCEALRAIGTHIEASDGGCTLKVIGPPADTSSEKLHELFIANSGTSVRFLTAALSAWGGRYRLSGIPRMHQRPIGDLVAAIAEVIDGEIETESDQGCPPVRISSNGWKRNYLQVAGNVSSQYLSGLMMAAPIATAHSGQPLKISVSGELVSLPYVQMTAEVMRCFAASVELLEGGDSTSRSVAVGVSGYQGLSYDIEPDASAASYFWAAAAITGGRVTVEGLGKDALQGDVRFCEVLAQMGCHVEASREAITVEGTSDLNGIDIDMNAISDTVQTLAVVALFAKGTTRVRGVAHNRFKETDRIGDLACELRKLGAVVDEHDDGMTITPPSPQPSAGAQLATYNDHRMAMSLSLAGLRLNGVRIENPTCTAKTYPEFFADLEQLIGRPHRWS